MPCGGNRSEKGRKRSPAPQLKLTIMEGIAILGLAAGTITSITFVPQVIKIWQTRSAKDLSVVMLLLLLLGVSMWLTYGILVRDIAIIYTNSMVMAMGLLMLYFKWRFSKNG